MGGAKESTNDRGDESGSVVRDREADQLKLSRATRAAVERLNGMLEADGVELVIERDSAEAIEKNIGDIEALAPSLRSTVEETGATGVRTIGAVRARYTLWEVPIASGRRVSEG